MCGDETTGTAIGTVLVENDKTRVTEWRFPKRGDNTGWHVHEYDYVVVPLFTGVLDMSEPNRDPFQAKLEKGVPYFRQRCIEHDVANGNEFECAFIEIEFLEA